MGTAVLVGESVLLDEGAFGVGVLESQVEGGGAAHGACSYYDEIVYFRHYL